MKTIISIHLIFTFVAFLCLGCANERTTPTVTAIYPSSDTLPENLLRMYVRFSQPMKTVGNLENIQLLDDSGQKGEGAIFNYVHELWDTEQKQLTFLFDPARVKTGLNANESFGRALQPGRSYRLLIKDLADVNHRKMSQAIIKEMKISAADTLAPAIDRWEIIVPEAQSKMPLIVRFPDMLDQQSLKYRLKVVTSSGKAISGTVRLGEQEKSWTFTPAQKWGRGDYQLLVNGRLEDPAGNNLNGLFDHKVGSRKYVREGEILYKEFTVGEQLKKVPDEKQ